VALEIPAKAIVRVHDIRSKLVDAEERSKTRTGGRPPKPSPQLYRIATAAAAVTLLRQRNYSVSEATTKVAKAARLDRKELEYFRNNRILSRKATDAVSRPIYDQVLAILKKVPAQDLEAAVIRLMDLCQIPPV